MLTDVMNKYTRLSLADQQRQAVQALHVYSPRDRGIM